MARPPAGARDAVAVRGADAAGYLQGQLSADVEALEVGTDTLALLLEPTGKLCAVVRVQRTADDELLLDADPGAGEVVVARLRRFLLRTAAVVEPAASVGSGPVEEVARVRAGWPAFGHEYGGVHSGEVIPAELGRWLVDEAVCFTKGCYVGQELTTRIESRGGNVPRRMRVFELATELTAAPGDRIVAVGDQGAAPVGTITSAVVDPATGITVVMGLVARRVAGDATLSVQPGSGM